MPDFIMKIKIEIQIIIIFMHISSSLSLCVFYSIKNEEKLVALLVYSSFQRVAISGIRKSSITTSNFG